MNDLPSTSEESCVAFEQVAPYYDLLMESVPYRFWLKYLHTVWEHHNHVPQNVIDLACGTGTVSLLMAREGMLVTGVDISGRMLAQARKKSSDAGLYIDYVQQDAANLDLESRGFDTVISMFDSLNNITNKDRLSACFRKVRQHMVPQGLFIFDVNTAYAFRQGMFDQKSLPTDGPLQYRWRSTYDEPSSICTVVMEFEYANADGSSNKFEETHIQKAYSTQDLLHLLGESGFGPINVYNAYSLAPSKRRSDRLFFVARAD